MLHSCNRKGERQAKISNACSVFSASNAKVPRLRHLPKDANNDEI